MFSRHRHRSLSSLEGAAMSDSNTSNSEQNGSSYEDLLDGNSLGPALGAETDSEAEHQSPEAAWLQAAGLGDLVLIGGDNRSSREFLKSLTLTPKQYNTIRKRIDDLHARVARQLQLANYNQLNRNQNQQSSSQQQSKCVNQLFANNPLKFNGVGSFMNNANNLMALGSKPIASVRPDCRSLFDHNQPHPPPPPPSASSTMTNTTKTIGSSSTQVTANNKVSL